MLKLYKFISRVNPILWFLFYFLTLLIFAVIYSSFYMNDFYHSTSIYEFNTINDSKHEIEKTIVDSIKRAVLRSRKYVTVINGDTVIGKFSPKVGDTISIFKSKNNNSTIYIKDKSKNAYMINSQTINVAGLELGGEDKLLFDIVIPINISGISAKKLSYEVKIPFMMVLEKNFFENTQKNHLHIKGNLSLFFTFQSLHRYVINLNSIESDDSLIQKVQRSLNGMSFFLDQQVVDKIENWRQAQNGFPGKSRGTFWRMMYFSAITITTVGFGDIVPLTDSVRMWVAAEAILGIILIGLFLNSVAAWAAKLGG